MTVVRGRRAARVAVLLAVALAACTPGDGPDGPDPSPTAGGSPAATATGEDEAMERPSVAVVLPSRNARPVDEIERHRTLLADLSRDVREVVGEVRGVVPDRFSTVGDVVELLAEGGDHDLVCAVGPGAARAVREVAPRHPGVRFCAVPGRLPTVPGNALVFDVRVEEAAYLAGIAARFAADQVFGGGAGFPAIVVGDRNQAQRLVPGFEAGFLAVDGRTDATPLLVATDESQAVAAVEAQAGAGAFFVFASAGRAEVGVATAAADNGVLVAGTDAWLRGLVSEALEAQATPTPSPEASPTTTVPPSAGQEPSAVGPRWDLLRFREDLTTAVRRAIEELGTGWQGGSRTLGLADGTLAVEAGTSPIWPLVAPQVLAARDAIVAGDIVVPAT